MQKKWKITISGMIAVSSAVLLTMLATIFFSLLCLNDTRGLDVTGISYTNDARFPSVENTGRETVYFYGFHDENKIPIRMAKVDEQFWNGSCYGLPPEKFVTLILDEE